MIEDCTVGPQNNDIPVLGRYTHARSFLPRLRQLVQGYGDETIKYYNRDAIKVSDLADRLINQMDMIYNHFINNVEYDIHDPEWIAASKLFVNPTGWMDGGSSYGMIFNGLGAAVVGIGARTTETENITVNNVEIFGIYNQVIEKIKFSTKYGATRLIIFDAIDWMAVSDQIDDKYSSQYIGDAYTDVVFAAYTFIDSWYYLNSLYVSDAERTYIFDGNSEETGYPFVNGIFSAGSASKPIGGCNTDIQLHSSKGAIGLRLDGPQNFNLSNIYIHDIVNWADLGHDWCGEYDGPQVGDESIEIQYGYTGTRAHGLITDFAQGVIDNIFIENIESYHGEANGMTIYIGSDVTMQNIQVHNVNAGTKLTQDVVDTLIKPNLVPRACSVDIRDDAVVNFANGQYLDAISEMDVNGFDDCMSDGYHLGIANGQHHTNGQEMLNVNKFILSSNDEVIEILLICILVVILCIAGCCVFRFICIKIIHARTKPDDGLYFSLNERTPLIMS